MNSKCTLLAVSMLCLGLVACSDASLVTPEGPRFDGGSTFGGGNRNQDTTIVTSTTGDGTTARGGSTFGGGN